MSQRTPAVRHMFVPLSTGLTPHVLFCPSPVQPPKASVIFLHGFPDTNWGWRHLLGPVAMAGFDAYAPSMRGYGPYDREVVQTDEDCKMENICRDIDALMAALMVDHAVIVGHDWGGTTAWNFACHYPHRTIAVASFCTPFFPVPEQNPWPKMQANPGRFLYQIFFHSDDARKVFEADLERTVLVMIRASTDAPVAKDDEAFQGQLMGLHLINGSPKEQDAAKTSARTSRSKMHSEQDLAIYVDQFRRCGFLNPMRWYRNVERNWKWNSERIKGNHVTVPSLMVTAANDGILTPSMTKGMDQWCDDLEIHHVQEASHWILQEQPVECSKILVTWLKKKVEPLLKRAVGPHTVSFL